MRAREREYYETTWLLYVADVMRFSRGALRRGELVVPRKRKSRAKAKEG